MVNTGICSTYCNIKICCILPVYLHIAHDSHNKQ